MLDYVLEVLDLVLAMTVNPGFGGQSFIEAMLPKIEQIRGMIEARGLNIDLITRMASLLGFTFTIHELIKAPEEKTWTAALDSMRAKMEDAIALYDASVVNDIEEVEDLLLI